MRLDTANTAVSDAQAEPAQIPEFKLCPGEALTAEQAKLRANELKAQLSQHFLNIANDRPRAVTGLLS